MSDNCVVMIVDATALPIAMAMMKHIHIIEPNRSYESIIFTPTHNVEIKDCSEIIIKDYSTIHNHLESALGSLSFLTSSTTITKESFGRFALGNILRSKYKKCLYIDYDVLVCGELSPSFLLDISNYDFAAVSSLDEISYSSIDNKLSKHLKFIELMGLQSLKDYFNSGVLLVNLERFDIDELANSIIKLNEQGAFFGRDWVGDQELLNRVYCGNWARLSPRWNLTSPFHIPEIVDIVRPRIMHFTGPDKPWHNSWIGHGAYRRDVLDALRAASVFPNPNRPRKSKFSDKFKKHLRIHQPFKEMASHKRQKEMRKYSDLFIDYYKNSMEKGLFCDAHLG